MKNPVKKIKKRWHDVKATSGFRKVLTFLIFVGIATSFWFILALNDSIQDDFEVKLEFSNVPDSVTFIDVPPKTIHVAVRDQATSLWRKAFLATPTLDINFRDYSKDGRLRFSRSELYAGLKNVFGAEASLLSTSVDSLNLQYTTLPGRRVPVVVSAEVSAEVGKVIHGKPVADPQSVYVFSTRPILDTVTRIFTEKITRSNLEESRVLSVKLRPIPGARIVPPNVKVNINVETLVRKKTTVNIAVDHLPAGMDLLLFPSSVEVEYFVPMSSFSRADISPEVRVDYRDYKSGTKRLPLHVGRHEKDILNVRILSDSVEYTLVKN